MNKNVVWGKYDDSVQQALLKMRKHNTDYMIIGRRTAPEGVISKSELTAMLSPYLRPEFAKWRQQLDDATLQIRVKWTMINPLRTINPATPLSAVIEKLNQSDTQCIAVANGGGKIQGLITRAETFKALTDSLDEWQAFCQGYTKDIRNLYISEVEKPIDHRPDGVAYISGLRKLCINSYLNRMMSRELINKTVNNSLCAIKSLCLYIHENYNIPNPASSMKKLKEYPANPNFWTMEQYKAVLKNSFKITRPWIRFIACTFGLPPFVLPDTMRGSHP